MRKIGPRIRFKMKDGVKQYEVTKQGKTCRVNIGLKMGLQKTV